MEKRAPTFLREATGLVREIGALESIALPTVGAAIGYGINVYAISGVTLYPGANIPLSYLIAGLFLVPFAACMSLLNTAMPRTGGSYVWISRVINPLVGWMSSWGLAMIAYMIACGITTYFSAYMYGLALYIAGEATKNAGMISLAQVLFSKEGSLVLALVLNVAFSILAALSSRIIGKVMDAVLIVGFAGSILLVALLFLTPIQSIPSAYDAVWGAGAFQEVLTVAKSNGFTGLPPPSNDATIHMILFGVLAYVGFEASQYLGGEIKRPKRTSLYAILGALIVLIIYYVAFSTGVWRYPGEFLYAYQYNVNGGFVSQYKINIPLTLSFVAFFATSLTTNSALQFFILISIATIMGVGLGIGCIVFGTRQIFAMSFDRFFPSKFAEVSDRFHMLGPYTIALAIVMTFAGSLSAYFNTFLAAINTIVMFAFAYMFTSIVAVVLPFVRRDIYERGLKLEIAGFPVITILGIVSLTTTLFILIISAASLDLTSQTFTALFYGFGALIWVYYLWKNSKIGVSVETIFREIPPE